MWYVGMRASWVRTRTHNGTACMHTRALAIAGMSTPTSAQHAIAYKELTKEDGCAAYEQTSYREGAQYPYAVQYVAIFWSIGRFIRLPPSPTSFPGD